VATVVLQGPQLKKSAVVYRRPPRIDVALQKPISATELDRLFAQVEAGIAPPSPVGHLVDVDYWCRGFR
jgi:hypothetical protein